MGGERKMEFLVDKDIVTMDLKKGEIRVNGELKELVPRDDKLKDVKVLKGDDFAVVEIYTENYGVVQYIVIGGMVWHSEMCDRKAEEIKYFVKDIKKIVRVKWDESGSYAIMTEVEMRNGNRKEILIWVLDD